MAIMIDKEDLFKLYYHCMMIEDFAFREARMYEREDMFESEVNGANKRDHIKRFIEICKSVCPDFEEDKEYWIEQIEKECNDDL